MTYKARVGDLLIKKETVNILNTTVIGIVISVSEFATRARWGGELLGEKTTTYLNSALDSLVEAGIYRVFKSK